jgi:glycerol-1-phosphate dehydrogenase [NAD(P)+]
VTSAALEAALRAARDTRRLDLFRGAIAATADVFREQFGDAEAVRVGDPETFRVTKDGQGRFSHGLIMLPAGIHAEWEHVEHVERELANTAAIPVAVGAGTINDITKLAAHRLGRPYLCVATAASMDGYTAYGASITKNGLKQTFDCPAPRAVVADIDIIAAAPNELTASGYADLLAKVTAGADWILADALGVEPIHEHAWRTVQGGLRAAVADPAGVQRGDAAAITKLTEGLMMGGFAMQAMQSSRSASGAEHQFSHLWDMQNHVDPRTGEAPSHGFKVGIGTLAVARLYETLLAQPIEKLDVDAAVARWPGWKATQDAIWGLFDIDELRDKAIEETRAKYPSADELRAQLTRLRDVWPDLKRRLLEQLIPSQQLATMLRDAGAPSRCEDIGISAERLRTSHRLAIHIRRRFTVLDLADRIGLLDA